MSLRHNALAHLAAALGAIALPTLVTAQAPVVTEKGDPSVKSDTIYALASTAGKYPEQSALVLLDDGIVKLEKDGRATSTYRQVIQVLTEEAVENLQEQSFSWVPGRQSLRINWIRVVRPDGSVISEKPSLVQDSDIPAEMSDPVYSDQRVRRVSLSGVAAGAIVDFSYTIVDEKPFPPNDHYGSWSVSMGSPVRRSRLILDVPADMAPLLYERNLNFKRVEAKAGNRRTYTWATAELPRVKPEQYAADSNAVYMHLAYALPRTWRDVGAWYASVSNDRYTMNADTRAAIAKAVKDARSREDSIRALHRWVAQDVRYISVALGTGGYIPRTPDEVVKTGFGDCKDKATIFVAALRAWGVRAHPVLLRTARVNRSLPSIQQFNHAIAAIEDGKGGYRFADLTAELTPWGELPYGPQGEFALVVREDGRVDEVTIPREPIEGNRKWTTITGTLTPDGTFDGWLTEGGVGLEQYELRDAFTTPLDSTKRVEFMRAIASSIYPGMNGDSLTTFNGKDLGAKVEYRIQLKGGKAASKAGQTVILSLPLGNLEGMTTHADQLEAQGPRRFTISADAVFPPAVRETVMRVTLPEGWKAQLPAGVHAKSVFGEFQSTYKQEGRDLVIVRRTVGARGTYAPEQLAELTKWLREMAKEDTRFIALETKPAAQ